MTLSKKTLGWLTTFAWLPTLIVGFMPLSDSSNSPLIGLTTPLFVILLISYIILKKKNVQTKKIKLVGYLALLLLAVQAITGIIVLQEKSNNWLWMPAIAFIFLVAYWFKKENTK